MIGRLLPLLIFLLASEALAEAAAPSKLAIDDFVYLDTSGEPRDQTAEHAARLAAMAVALRGELAESGLFEVVALAADGDEAACPEDGGACVLARARDSGADLLLLGAVQKISTMATQVWVSAFDVATAERVFYRHLSFRGDTDEAWQRASRYLTREIKTDPPRTPRGKGL
ncbi:MAG: DUF2380 domain-containing protein [Kiloniellales bacterium]